MSISISENLVIVKNLIESFKFEEGLQIINDFEQEENLTPEEALKTLNYKSWIYLGLGELEKSFITAEELYQKSQELNLPLFSLDALFRKEMVLLFGKHDELNRILNQRESLFNSIPREDSEEFKEREASLFVMKASVNYWMGNLDLALDYHNKSMKLLEQINSPYLIGLNYISMAYAYHDKGELNLAIKYNEKALSLIPEEENFAIMTRKATIYRRIGLSYYEKGDLNRALEYNMQSLEFFKKIDGRGGIGRVYANIIAILLAKKDLNQARYYLQQFKDFNENHKDDYPYGEKYLLYQVASALILKQSPRMHDRVEAEKILKKIVRENADKLYIINIALSNLCEWYFEEFRISNQMEILYDIQPLIDQLQKIAKFSNSYSLLANVKLLQAKLALLQVSMVEARKLLTEAQQIAEEHGLQLLAGEISKEHDHLLEELKLWESFKKEQASVAERLKLASIDPVLDRMQGKRALEPLESSGQQPVSLLILAEGGVLLFSYPFSDEWKQDDDLFGSFLSAFSTFSDEFFSQGLDRAKFGEDTILLQSVGSFSVCYLFRGQTYFAKQKLEKFAEILKKDASIWETLEKFEKSSQVAELKDLPKMENLLNDVFLSVNP